MPFTSFYKHFSQESLLFWIFQQEIFSYSHFSSSFSQHTFMSLMSMYQHGERFFFWIEIIGSEDRIQIKYILLLSICAFVKKMKWKKKEIETTFTHKTIHLVHLRIIYLNIFFFHSFHPLYLFIAFFILRYSINEIDYKKNSSRWWSNRKKKKNNK